MRIQVDVRSKIECRGRNGWFNAERATVTKFNNGDVEIGLASGKAFRDSAPIILMAPADQLQTLLSELLAAVEKVASERQQSVPTPPSEPKSEEDLKAEGWVGKY